MTIRAKQQVVLLRKFGGPDGFAVVECRIPEPGAGEVLVKVLAASVQFTDVMLRKGQYPDLKDKPPLVLGYDLVGEVVTVGPGVSSPAAMFGVPPVADMPIWFGLWVQRILIANGSTTRKL